MRDFAVVQSLARSQIGSLQRIERWPPPCMRRVLVVAFRCEHCNPRFISILCSCFVHRRPACLRCPLEECIQKKNSKCWRSIWRVMEQAHWHSFQVLTKRPERMLDVLSGPNFPMLPNVWLGNSVESEDYIGRIDHLRRVPAAIRFISFEPLLGPIPGPDLAGVHWAIVGGESGPHARQVKENWVEDLRDTCRDQGVAFFFKQWGGTRKKKSGRLLKGRLWEEYPNSTSARLNA